MKGFLSASSLLLLAAVLTCAAGDDLAALKDTLLNLCAKNGVGKFASCCLSSNNGQDITSVGSVPSCFGSVTVTGDTVTELFVSHGTAISSNEFGKSPQLHPKKGTDNYPGQCLLWAQIVDGPAILWNVERSRFPSTEIALSVLTPSRLSRRICSLTSHHWHLWSGAASAVCCPPFHI